jgi:hypothetical protein
LPEWRWNDFCFTVFQFLPLPAGYSQPQSQPSQEVEVRHRQAEMRASSNHEGARQSSGSATLIHSILEAHPPLFDSQANAWR